ncbi:hypothetical protein KG918_003455 [Salmonella enterica]|uniref:hypothetical protein n=1 Tax=Salmonella enterica TaxID=28901 RepID=UPI000B5483F1|nr:hypothetical protein [Salmonella enterica]EDT8784884.1 hypothetical protein [Salmonella enterica subsp. diarizonae]ASG84182.1 hypothetical protein LFZ55_15305 [Salmonella enterica subsp. diarizonae serovar 65:c:z str. SA20044251]EEA3739324.1 hypothetical protein [Salmonella enterica]EEE1922290.1 hypothetical protein [Salmonella enterica subsp. diarizonae]EEF4030836.1 hypothetical protein [Salmonella enterica]
MTLKPFSLVVALAAFFTLSVAQAQIYTCTFKNGTSVKINDHFDGDPTVQNHNAITYVHYNQAGKADLALTAVAIGWVNQAHAVTEYYRFKNGDYNYVALHDGLTPFDGLSIYKGTQLIAKQPCTGDGWSPALDPSSTALPNDDDGQFADTFMQ